MRPVERGDIPRVGGKAVVFADFRDANGPLEQRLGKYCCYCERRFDSMLEVEHLSPKSRDPAKLTDWDNFLLACKICNTVKRSKPTNDKDFLWPDRDNTFLAFQYQPGGFVEVSSKLDKDNITRATKLLDLVGLDRHQDRGWPDPTDRDCRWEDRETRWKYAERIKRLFPNPTAEEANVIADGAALMGFFSVWMAVFGDVPVVQTRLIEAFKAAKNCFDINGKTVPRPNGRI